MERVRKRLAHLLAVVLMFALVAPAAPQITTNAATKKAVKNPITELGIKELPEGNTVKVGSVFNFNPDIIATERGKGKTTGIVWWEVNAGTNAAGVSSSRWGYVYPVYEGSFEIRALAFANTKDLNAWKAARKANGNVADETAMSSYVTAVTDWVKINVVSDTEGYAVARTQYQLNLALKNKKATEIHIKTDKEVAFTIPARNYTSRTLTVDAPNAEVENAGRFAQIKIRQIKASTFTEKAYGNRFHVTAPNARLVLLNRGGTKEVVFEPEKDAKDPYIIIVGGGGRLNALDVAAPGKVEISGVLIGEAKHNAVVVNVAEEAAGTGIQTEVALEVNAASDVAVTVEKAEGSETVSDASKTVVNMEKAAKVTVDGTAANGTTVVVKGGAKGSEIASDAALVIIADADVMLNLTESAAGTTVTKGENVKVELSAESTVEGVSVTDVNGEVETIKPGEDSAEVTVAPSATPAPSAIPTTTPSGGSSGGSSGWTPSYPSATPTPTPTPIPAKSMSYSVGNKTENLSFEEGSKEAVIALPADSQSETVTLTINGVSEKKALVTGVNVVSVEGYTVKFVVPLASVRISASLSKIKLSTTSGAAVTGSAIRNLQVEDDFSGFTADADFTIVYEWKKDGVVLPDLNSRGIKADVEVRVEDGFVIYTEPEERTVVVKVIHNRTGEILAMQSNSIKGDIREKNRPRDFLSYSISGGELTDEIKGEIELQAPGYWDENILDDYQRDYAVLLSHNYHARGATVTATLASTGETITTELDMLGKCLRIEEYNISFLSQTETEIPTAVSAQYNVIQSAEGEEGKVEVTLSAHFTNPDALKCEGGIYGICWYNPSGEIIGFASWQDSSWWKGGYEAWEYSYPYSVNGSEDNKVVNLICTLTLSEASKAEDIKGYYAYMFYEVLNYHTGGEHWIWWAMPPKLVIENVTDIVNE